MPSRAPRVPSIGLVSSSERTRSSVRSSRRTSRGRSWRARSSSTARSSLLGRNSCSGGSSSRIVTGRSAIASNSPSKSSVCSGSSSASAARRCSPSSAMIIACIFGLAVRGHEHVLGAAQPDPLRAELARAAGVLGRVGVRAHAEPADLVGPAGARCRSWRRRPAPTAARRRRSPSRSSRRSRSVSPFVQLGVAGAQRAGLEVDAAAPARPPRTACPSRARRARRATPCRPRR